MTDLEKVNKIVEDVLGSDIRARNDDKWLVYKVVSRFTRVFIPFEDFNKFPSFESITRARRYIQYNEGKLLPTDPEVLEKREKHRKKFRDFYAQKKSYSSITHQLENSGTQQKLSAVL